MAQEALLVIGDNLYPGDEGFIDPVSSEWTHNPEFSVDELIGLMDSKEQWEAWLEREIEDYQDIRGLAYYHDLKCNPIRNPIILSYVNGKYYIWDGWHRVAAAIAGGRETIPAYIGQIIQ
ncbi:ParB N-terminal domain-containing protein [Neptuniibacter sp. QD37_11]|uniref:ParB N-terminal domain-containing protein n=1 Tax=Neptuniibacter sp. QD37_11 TaxID=3398209 RepID=UPI0039F60AEE